MQISKNSLNQTVDMINITNVILLTCKTGNGYRQETHPLPLPGGESFSLHLAPLSS
jgi:hypothetical protein